MTHRRPSRPAPSRRWFGRESTAATAAVTAAAAARRARRLAGPVGQAIEALEGRRLLTTVNGFVDPATGVTPGLRETLFTDGEGNPAVIYSYDVDFTAIGAHRGTSIMNPAARLDDLADYPLPTVGTPTPTGTDVFKIYVTASGPDSFISVVEFAPQVPGGPPFTLLPYSGAIGTVGVRNTGGAYVAGTTLPSVGGILVGGVFFGPGPDQPQTDLTISLPYAFPIGTQPIPASGQLTAGIEVTPVNTVTGTVNDFGRIAIGGSVTGLVSFPGNLDQFYAGGIFTGDSTGGFLYGNGLQEGLNASTNPTPGNFSVGGDLRSLITAGRLGTDGIPLPSDYGNTNNDPGFYNYVSDFELDVGGNLGEVHTGNVAAGQNNSTFGGTIRVSHDPLISGQTPSTDPAQVVGNRAVANEVELTNGNTQGLSNQQRFAFGQAGLRANVPDNVFAIARVDLQNDSLADAQILGTFSQTDPNTGVVLRDANNVVLTETSVNGIIDAGPDTTDFYGVAMMGGQTFVATLTGAQQLLVYDPDGRVIQSNAEVGNGQSIRVQADRPGVYKFQVSNGATTAYNLTLLMVGDLGIGGVVINGSYTDNGVDGGVITNAGDIGVISLTGTYYGLTSGGELAADASGLAPQVAPSTIVVANGNLRALTAGNLGETELNVQVLYGSAGINNSSGLASYDYSFGPILNVPVGNVGLIQTTGLAFLFTQIDPSYVGSNDYGDIRAYTHSIGGSIQVIDAGTTLSAFIGVKAGIGTIRAGNMATGTPSQINVNADDTGNDGRIDLIDIEGNLGTLNSGGPSIYTRTGGDVRYLRVAGSIFLPIARGSTVDQPANFPIGQGTTFTDDSGNQVTLTPMGVTTTNTSGGIVTNNSSSGTTTTTSGTFRTDTFSPGPGVVVVQVTNSVDGSVTQTITTGPQLSVLAYPIADKGGLIPVSVNSTGSLVISATGTAGPSAQVDIGSVTIAGLGRPIVASGVDQFGNPSLVQLGASGAATANGSGGTTTTTFDTTGATASGTPLNIANVTATATTDPTDLFLSVTGQARINVLDTNSVQTILGFAGSGLVTNTGGGTIGAGSNSTITAPGTAYPVAIANDTGGEMANVVVNGIGTLQVRGNLGFITPQATPAAVLPRPVITGGNAYPFAQQHTGINLNNDTTATSGSAININAGGAIANVIAAPNSTGTIVSLVADFNNNPTAGLFAGITGPIEATRLISVQVGQGLADTGTGAVSHGGLYATNKIGRVNNAGILDGDIRGDIVALNINNATFRSIDQISLGSASIIGSKILDLAGPAYLSIPVTYNDAFSVASDVGGYPDLIVERLGGNPITTTGRATQYDFGSINITGYGGILGSTIIAGSVGPITVAAGGYGVLNTRVEGLSGGRIAGITAHGYGIRQVDINNGGYIGLINATDDGTLVPVTNFPIDVRPSDNDQLQGFDPFTGNAITNGNDLNAALGGGTSVRAPVLANVTDTGVVEDLTVEANNDMLGLTAQKVRTRGPVTTIAVQPNTPQANIPVVGVPFASSLAVSGRLGYVRVRELIDGLQIAAGRLDQFDQTGDVNRLGISVAGPINRLTIRGNLGAVITDPATGAPLRDSYIRANGQSGRLNNLTVYGSMYADVLTTGSIGKIDVRGDLSGTITAQGNTARRASLKSLTVAGVIQNGTLNVTGKVGSITTSGGLGGPGQSLTVNGSVDRLTVGASRAPGSVMALDLTVNGTLGTFLVNGRITGSVHVLRDLRSLQVNSDASAPDAVSGAITVDGRLLNARINNGNVANNVTVAGDVGNFTINNGSLAANATLSSTLQSIRNVRVTGGLTSGINGSIVALGGSNLRVTTTGNFGDGTDRAVIAARSAALVSIGGSINNNAAVMINGLLNQLVVGQDIASAGSVTAGHINRSRIGGANNGTVVGV